MKTTTLSLALTLALVPATSLPAHAQTVPETSARPAVEIPAETLSAVRSRGLLRVGVTQVAPWTMMAEDGSLHGFQVDLAHRLADDLGVELELVLLATDDLMHELDNGQIDLVGSGMTISPQRALVASFSDPVAYTSYWLVASRKATASRRSVGDFDASGVVVGVLADTPAEWLARRTFPGAEIKTFDSETSLADAVTGGSIAGALGRTPMPEISAALDPERLVLVGGVPTRFAEAFAIRRGDPDFLAWLNTWILFHTEDGWLPDRRDFWFKSFGAPAGMPGN